MAVLPVQWPANGLQDPDLGSPKPLTFAPEARSLREVVERVTGIEPALSAWEADVLPLNYTRERHHCT
jgi:hypothetical protein